MATKIGTLDTIGKTITRQIWLQPSYTYAGTTYAAWPCKYGVRLTLKGQEGMKSIIHYETYVSTEANNGKLLYFLAFASYPNFSQPFEITLNGQAIHSDYSFKGTQYFSGRNIILTSGDFELTRATDTNIGDLQLAFVIPQSSRLQGDSDNPSPFNGTAYLTARTEEFVLDVLSTTVSGAGASITYISDFTDEAGPTIDYMYDKGTSVEAAKIEIGVAFNGSNIVLPYREIPIDENSYLFDFTPDDLNTLYTLLHNGETATLRFFLKTTETIAGELIPIISEPFTKTFTFVDYKPKLEPTLTDLNDATFALTGNREHLVRYFSKVAYDMNVELRKGALDIIGCYIQNGDRIEEGFTSGTFENPTTNVFYFSATDDRGYTGTASKSLSLFDGEFINYIKLSSSLKSTPISGEGDISITITGKYFNASFGREQNKLDMQYAIYKKGTTPSWKPVQTITPEMVDNETYTYTFSDSGLDYTAQYVVAVRLNDRLMTSESSISVVAKPVFYWNNDEFIFNVPVKYPDGTADLVVEEKTVAGYYMNASSQYTSGGYSWTYRKWSSGLLECWCTIPVSTTVNTAWGNMYVAAVSNIYKTDLSYPVQPTATPNITVTLGAGATKGMLIADNSYAADNVSTGRYNIASPVSITSSATFRLNYYVRGKWK